jgi:pyrroline-5-carboxylate reductase
MAKIICRAIDRSKLIPRSQILFLRRDSRKIHEDEMAFKITSTRLPTLVDKSDILLLCVRPGQAKEVLEQMSQMEMKEKKLISILAGTKISYFEQFLQHQPLIRAMPNVASEVGEGMTILSPSPHADAEFRSLATLLFGSMGQTIDLPEEMMDLATAMAGSGPAFVFSLIEAVARYGEKGGIAYDQSLRMAAQTFLGAARILLKGGVAIDELLRQIAVPNGTTEAGLKVMRDLEIDKHFQQVIEASAKRSKAISEEA